MGSALNRLALVAFSAETEAYIEAVGEGDESGDVAEWKLPGDWVAAAERNVCAADAAEWKLKVEAALGEAGRWRTEAAGLTKLVVSSVSSPSSAPVSVIVEPRGVQKSPAFEAVDEEDSAARR